MTNPLNSSAPKGTVVGDIDAWSNSVLTILQRLTLEQKETLLIGGPGLTADVLDIECDAKAGKMYFIMTKDIDEVAEAIGDQYSRKPTDSFDSLWVSPACAIAVMDPVRRLPSHIKQENVRPLNLDCLLKFTDGHNQLLQPKDLSGQKEVEFNKNLGLGKHIAFAFGPLAQISAKCYSRMGFQLSEKLLKELFLYRCSLTRTQQTPILFQAFREEFPFERITQIV